MGKRQISVLSVMAMGIGSMVGAGIFSLMGQAALAAGDWVCLSFILGGAAALLSGLSYGRLGARYPTAGGILAYFNTAFGPGVIAGGLGIIYYATLAITISMVAQAFGAYGSSLLQLAGWAVQPGWLAAGIIVLLGFLNLLGAGIVGKAEIWLVFIKLGILLLLLGAGLPGLETAHARLGGNGLSHAAGLPGSVGLTFFAYAGYGMMANAAPNLANPQKELPRAIIGAIAFVAVLYVLLSLVITRQISPQELAEHADTAVAAAAAPLLGKAGYICVTVAALVATASAINATLFSMLRIANALGQRGEANRFFATRIWKEGSWGYLLTLALCLMMALLLNLAETASVAGGTFLISYLAVYAAHWKLRRETATPGWHIIPGFVLMLVVFIGFMSSLSRSAPLLPALILGVVAAGFLLEWVVQRTKGN